MTGTKPLKWPDRLTLRDTKVFADEGQRIFSTATGYGYAKQEYVRADLSGIDISHIEVMALKKLALINGALAQSLKDPVAKIEQTALLSVLMDVASRADLANQTARATSPTGA
jgi:hypothetical protein